jgi:hypothetical protein
VTRDGAGRPLWPGQRVVLPDGRLGVYAPQEGRGVVRIHHPRVGLVRTGETVEADPATLRRPPAELSDASISARVRVTSTTAGDRWLPARVAGARAALPRRAATWLQHDDAGDHLPEVRCWLLWLGTGPAPAWHQAQDTEVFDVYGYLLAARPRAEAHTIAIYEEVPHGG